MRSLSPNGVTFIESWEVYRPVGYMPTAADRPTAGWGHTGTDVQVGVTYSRDQCEQWFDDDIGWAESTVDQHARQDLTQNQFDALVSICFNIGQGAFDASTLLRDVNASDDEDAENEFLRWDKQRGMVLSGLSRRRAAERDLYMTV